MNLIYVIYLYVNKLLIRFIKFLQYIILKGFDRKGRGRKKILREYKICENLSDLRETFNYPLKGTMT